MVFSNFPSNAPQILMYLSAARMKQQQIYYKLDSIMVKTPKSTDITKILKTTPKTALYPFFDIHMYTLPVHKKHASTTTDYRYKPP